LALPVWVDVDSAENPEDPWDAPLMQRTYRRVGARWITHDEYWTDSEQDEETDEFSWYTGAARLDEGWHSVVTTAEPGVLAPVTTLDTPAFSQYFRCRLSQCPHPETEEFWAEYQEPTVGLLRASWKLRQIEAKRARHDGRATDEHWRLLQHTGFYPGQNGLPERRVASLLHAYALQPTKEPRTCACCAAPFFPNHPRQVFCCNRCQKRCSKRRQRATPSSAAKLAAKERVPAKAPRRATHD
jgi:hypothetical protein